MYEFDTETSSYRFQSHPEEREGETFWSNYSEKVPKSMEAFGRRKDLDPTVRRGKVAYNKKGERLPAHYFPVFVARPQDA